MHYITNHPSFIRLVILILFIYPTLLNAGRMFYQAVSPNIKQQLSHYGYASQEKEWELKNKKDIYNYRAREYDPADSTHKCNPSI